MQALATEFSCWAGKKIRAACYEGEETFRTHTRIALTTIIRHFWSPGRSKNSGQWSQERRTVLLTTS
jgi:hypothetical protein